MMLKVKLLTIVLGDDRIEVDWGVKANGSLSKQLRSRRAR
jgi:hypothetical protein